MSNDPALMPDELVASLARQISSLPPEVAAKVRAELRAWELPAATGVAGAGLVEVVAATDAVAMTISGPASPTASADGVLDAVRRLSPSRKLALAVALSVIETCSAVDTKSMAGAISIGGDASVAQPAVAPSGNSTAFAISIGGSATVTRQVAPPAPPAPAPAPRGPVCE